MLILWSRDPLKVALVEIHLSIRLKYILASFRFKRDMPLDAYLAFKRDLLCIYMVYYAEVSDKNLPCFKDVYLQVFISKPPKCDILELDFGNRLSLEEQKDKDYTPNQNSEEERSCPEDGNARFHYRGLL
ncbi:hypothetical protein TNCV_4497711 [Trichonephila clavipes]|nr:hypothetical protein TNCV_4497711 [Trichonephila clavipes]